MANYGLSKPWIAKLDPETEKYTNAFKCGEAVSTSVTPTYNEASLRGDNKEVRNKKKFKNAAVSMGVTHMPVKAKSVMFGHTVSEDEKTEESNSADEANYVGYGFISEETLGDDDVFVACILHKVIFAEGEEAYTTEGDSITFSTPTVSGTAIPLKDGKWRTKQVFDTEEDADELIQQQLGVTAAA